MNSQKAKIFTMLVVGTLALGVTAWKGAAEWLHAASEITAFLTFVLAAFALPPKAKAELEMLVSLLSQNGGLPPDAQLAVEELKVKYKLNVSTKEAGEKP